MDTLVLGTLVDAEAAYRRQEAGRVMREARAAASAPRRPAGRIPRLPRLRRPAGPVPAGAGHLPGSGAWQRAR
ncbi:hypothetical protein [Cellulomonas endophytica]|uniref:hypothetical protein n=1 Tax=Cellulomonas endophytica TaxID=2494735 RepID=UPI001011B85E|nr:hypothetical protein [Cellulomonas endophytica]